ncbi:sugar transferase [Bifidobacterium sp.]|uniref:sugar transferase n=1 Tax=Bifidobacterium sp. TaxID=41200 RepID=UPI0039E7FA08
MQESSFSTEDSTTRTIEPETGNDARKRYGRVRDRSARLSISLSDLSHGRHQSQIPRWRYMYLASLVAQDVLAMLLSLWFCLLVKSDSYITLTDSFSFWAFAVFQCLIWVLSLLGAGAYRRHIMTDGYRIYAIILNAGVITVVVTGYLVYMFQLELPRTAVIEAPTVAALVEILGRWCSRKVLLRLRTKNLCKYDTVIMGSVDGILESLHMLDTCNTLGYRPVAVCPVETNANFTQDISALSVSKLIFSKFPVKILPFSNSIADDMQSMKSQILLVTDAVSRDSEHMRALSLLLESRSIELAFTVSVADVGGHRLHLRDTMQQNVLTASLPQYSFFAAMIKRTFDVMVSSFALLVLCPFVMLPIALMIKHEDKGPIFYCQERIGKNGKPFKFYKFRSMQSNADQLDKMLAEEYGQEYGALFKLKDDPRVTAIGKVLRKYSLDEIPQFYNVLKGDMSIVGPRPQRQYEVDKYSKLYSTRLLVKPGITGPWQISGRSNLSQEQAEQLDVSYIENWSITSDVVIMLKTGVVMFRGVGAY